MLNDLFEMAVPTSDGFKAFISELRSLKLPPVFSPEAAKRSKRPDLSYLPFYLAIYVKTLWLLARSL